MIYFVSYCYNGGFGNCEIEQVVLTNFIKLGNTKKGE